MNLIIAFCPGDIASGVDTLSCGITRLWVMDPSLVMFNVTFSPADTVISLGVMINWPAELLSATLNSILFCVDLPTVKLACVLLRLELVAAGTVVCWAATVVVGAAGTRVDDATLVPT